MLYWHEVIFIVYVYNGIFTSPRGAEIDQAITKIGSKFEIEDQETLNYYTGINIETLPGGKIKLSQTHPIDQIVQDVNIVQRAPLGSTPTKYITIL